MADYWKVKFSLANDNESAFLSMSGVMMVLADDILDAIEKAKSRIKRFDYRIYDIEAVIRNKADEKDAR